MPQPTHKMEMIARRGEELYQSSIRPKVESDFDGKILAIDVNSGDYEIDDTTMPAGDRLRLRHSDAELYFLRIGHDAVYTFNGRPSKLAK